MLKDAKVISRDLTEGIANTGVAASLARLEGWRSIGLHVIDFNEPARRLYESAGYELVATHNDSCFYEKRVEPSK